MRPNALTRQHAEEAAISALVMQRDALSREFAQLQNEYEAMREKKERIEEAANLLVSETKKLEGLQAELLAETEQAADTLQDLKEDVKVENRSAVNMRKATDAVRTQRDIAIADMDQVEEEYGKMKREHQNALQKLRDEKAFLLGELDRLKVTQEPYLNERATAQNALRAVEQDLCSREEQVRDHLKSAVELEHNTHILRARLKNLADAHMCSQCGTANPIHFNLQI